MSVSFWFSIIRLYLSRSLSISSKFSNLLAYNCSILLWFFISLWYCLFILFHFLFCLFGSFFFLSWWTWLKAYQFCLCFKKTIFSFIDLFIVFLGFFISSLSLLLHSFCWFGFCLFFFFLIPLDGSLDCSLEIFLFLEIGLY